MLLKKGDKGCTIKILQNNLIKLNYHCGSCGSDSIFGQGTYNAVCSFQKDHSLSVDGIVGPNTLSTLNKLLNKDINIIETNLNFTSLNFTNNPNLIILHHSEHKTWNVYDIHAFHKDEKHWSGIGYHFFITKDGEIYKGRPETAIGAHCLNHNTNSLGICVQGNYMVELMPSIQKQAVINLCKYLSTKYSIKNIKGHKEIGDTDCPGINYPLDNIKNSFN